MRHVNILAMLGIFIFCSFSFANEDWEQVKGMQEANMQDVSMSPFNKAIYVSTEKTLHRSEDDGNNWLEVFSGQGEDNEINFTGIFEQGVFICAKKGLFKSEDGKSNWKRVFEGSAEHIAFSRDGRIFLGAKKGLFISLDNGFTWQKDTGEIGNISIRWIEFMDEEIFIAAEKGVYKNTASGWKRTFVTNRTETEYDADITDDDIQAIKPVNSIALGKNNVFLATDSGVFFSEDKGETWSRFTSAGLVSLKAKKLLCEDDLYVATDKGVFVFSEKDNAWKGLYKGMPTKDTRDIAIDANGYLWAATKKGAHKMKLEGVSPDKDTKAYSEKERILAAFDFEPDISSVQNAAIKYAEVHPDKIKRWREAARQKALLPDVSIGVDRDVTDLYHWEGGSTTVINDDFLRKGKDITAWDITMSWNLGSLIWDDDQTNIDVRSKLMVELRNDIMNEVTRTYFERRRLQVELFTSPPQDLKLGLEKELRLQELTADIDALTGGYFSKHIKE
ncbi:MAG: hypothetical protein Q8N76_06440 [Candidatus Omnitrophota bacterium]|nr:hypothetical protein [Candidatus Omnitrophota bacterium]